MVPASGKAERGQVTMEALFALLVLAPVFAFALQLGFEAHYAHALDAAIEHARYSASPGDAATGEAAETTIARLMREASPELNTGELKVASASIEYVAGFKTSEDLPDADFDNYRIATRNATHGSIAVKAQITYTPPRFLPVGFEAPMSRTIDSERGYDAVFELG